MADIRKRKNDSGKTIYQVRFRNNSTKSGFGYKSFKSAKLANQFKAQKDLEEVPQNIDVRISNMNQAVEFWLELCKTKGTSKRDEAVTPLTLTHYKYFGTFITRYPWPETLQNLRTPHIVVFKDWLLDTCASRDQARRVLSCLHTVFKELALRGIVSSNIAAGVSIKKESRFDEEVLIPTQNEFTDLLRASDQLANSKNAQTANTWERYRPMLYYAGDTGMRPQEYLAMPFYNLDENGSHVKQAIESPGVRISVTKSKNGRRYIPNSKDILYMINHYYKHHAAQSKYDLIFPALNGNWQSVRNWNQRGFAVACEKAGLMLETHEAGKTIIKPKYTPYSLRHYYASALIENGVNLKAIQLRMGHADIQTTLNIYGHLLETSEANSANQKGLFDLGT